MHLVVILFKQTFVTLIVKFVLFSRAEPKDAAIHILNGWWTVVVQLDTLVIIL